MVAAASESDEGVKTIFVIAAKVVTEKTDRDADVRVIVIIDIAFVGAIIGGVNKAVFILGSDNGNVS